MLTGSVVVIVSVRARPALARHLTAHGGVDVREELLRGGMDRGRGRTRGDLEAPVFKHLDFRPKAMIERLDLRRPIYKETARNGHFGWEGPGYTWEELDCVDVFKKDAGL